MTRQQRWPIGGMPAQACAGSARQGGFALAEIAIAMLVLVVAVGGLSSALMSGINLSRANDEMQTAREQAFAMAEQVQAADFDQIFALFNSDPADDPGGIGTAPGSGFDIDQLTAAPGDADGMVGAILFPVVNDAVAGLELREDVLDPALGMPRDLNGDGDVDTLNHEGDFVLLPVTVRLEWQGISGVMKTELNLLLVQ